jgi:hypothetical protein
MFKFLRERRQREVLTLFEAELARTQKAYAVYATPHDLATQAALLERATAEDLAEHPTIKRLEFLHRLLAGLVTGIEDSAIPAFLDEARALGLTETDGIRLLLEQQRKQALAAIPPTPPPAPVSATPQIPYRDRDDEAWERYEDREIDGAYSWTYDGTTVHYSDNSWQYHEPDTNRPKAIDERFYNELSPDHVARLLAKGRVRRHLEQAAHVAYMRRKHSHEARALADLLTRQCIEVNPKRCSWTVFDWRAKLLIEQGATANAIAVLKQGLDVCREDPGPERLLKALQKAERPTAPRRKKPEVIDRPATGHNALERWTEIQGLKQARQYADLERVLLEFVDSVERDDQKGGIATAAYWELAVLYRKLKRKSDEVAILERFEKHPHGPGALPRKLLERLMKVSGRTIPLPPKPVYDPRPRQHNFMAVVGESFRQDVLRAALETHGHAEHAVLATLECEPENEADANAVAVKIGGQLVGYLASDVAERFRPFIAASATPVICQATLRGGTEDKPHIGIVVDFSPVYLLRDDPAL